jgi:hypothetical protein
LPILVTPFVDEACLPRLHLRVVSVQKLGSQSEKLIGSLEVCQMPGTDLSAHCTGNARGQLGCPCDDLIVGTVTLSIICMITIIYNLVRVMLGGKSRHREAGA